MHSVYGTNVFKHESLPKTPESRARVVACAGKKAEALAWLFCNLDRPKALLGPSRYMTCAEMGPIFYDLQAIEIANLYEQGGIPSIVRWFKG